MIFNKSKNGSLELKALVGFIYKSFNFDNLITYLSFAERDLKRIIGREIFIIAEAHYKSDNYMVAEAPTEPPEGEPIPTDPPPAHPEYATLDELVHKMQLALAFLAYRRYVPSNDLAHTDKGRTIYSGENEKQAFEWQIVRDNENLLMLSGEAIDALLEFLDEHIDDKVAAEGETFNNLLPWGTSEQYKELKSLIVCSVDQFEKVFKIAGSRMVFLSLIPFLQSVQKTTILACLGKAKYDVILEKIIDKEKDDALTATIELIQQPMVLLALSMAIRRLSVEILPDGIFSNFTTSVIKAKNAASKLDRNEVSSYLEKDGLKMLRLLQEHIRKTNTEAAGETFTVESLTERIKPDTLYTRI